MFSRTESSSTGWDWPSWVQPGQLSSWSDGQCYGRPSLLQDFPEQVWCILMGYSCRDFGLNEVAVCLTTKCANWTTPQKHVSVYLKISRGMNCFLLLVISLSEDTFRHTFHIFCAFQAEELVTPTLFTEVSKNSNCYQLWQHIKLGTFKGRWAFLTSIYQENMPTDLA